MSAQKTKMSGHASHTQDAAARGLPGQILRPIKITMLGAGSAFTPRLMNDVLRIPGDQGGTIALVDIDRERLETMVKLITRLTQQLGKTNWKVIGSADRRKVMSGSTYIVNCIEVSGTACVRFDNDIPAKYGINQCIGDTMRTWEFPAAPYYSGNVRIVYPFVLKPKVPEPPAGIEVTDEELAKIGITKDPEPPAADVIF